MGKRGAKKRNLPTAGGSGDNAKVEPVGGVPHRNSGSKYVRVIHPAAGSGQPIPVDVYCVLKAFNVTCPARAHAIKKLLCAGLRGKGDAEQDLNETIDAVRRAVQLTKQERSDEQTSQPKATAAGECHIEWKLPG